MSAPPLPDIFGNYVLGDFVEVVSPENISWLPQTAGWVWLGAFLLAVLLRYGYNAVAIKDDKEVLPSKFFFFFTLMMKPI